MFTILWHIGHFSNFIVSIRSTCPKPLRVFPGWSYFGLAATFCPACPEVCGLASSAGLDSVGWNCSQKSGFLACRTIALTEGWLCAFIPTFLPQSVKLVRFPSVFLISVSKINLCTFGMKMGKNTSFSPTSKDGWGYNVPLALPDILIQHNRLRTKDDPHECLTISFRTAIPSYAKSSLSSS